MSYVGDGATAPWLAFTSSDFLLTVITKWIQLGDVISPATNGPQLWMHSVFFNYWKCSKLFNEVWNVVFRLKYAIPEGCTVKLGFTSFRFREGKLQKCLVDIFWGRWKGCFWESFFSEVFSKTLFWPRNCAISVCVLLKERFLRKSRINWKQGAVSSWGSRDRAIKDVRSYQFLDHLVSLGPPHRKIKVTKTLVQFGLIDWLTRHGSAGNTQSWTSWYVQCISRCFRTRARNARKGEFCVMRFAKLEIKT